MNKLWLIGNDIDTNGILGLINCLRLEPGGEALRCLFDCQENIGIPIDFKQEQFYDILKNDLPINVLKNNRIGTYRHLSLSKDFDKTESNDYFLNKSLNSDLTGLELIDSSKWSPTCINVENSEEKQITCSIYCAGLNFKDIMFASGQLTAGEQSIVSDCFIGNDFVGRRNDTGERVMGFTDSRSFGTKIIALKSMITSIPEQWSMKEAVTLLSTYDTICYGLIERAQLKRGESILIHSGTGGVGQAAINVCKYYECDIFVTVGNNDKKFFLMDEYNIPEERIFSSKSIDFKYKIKILTKEKGVDIVLNSVTGDKWDASLECVAVSGRFVEIGKYELQMNKQLGTFVFLKNISFIAVHIDIQLILISESSKNFFKWIHQNSTNGMIKPIKSQVFDIEDGVKAFQLMTSGQHIGKIVIKIRDEENERNAIKVIKPPKTLTVKTKTYFDPNKIYIITGGLGGFGLELFNWMLFLGARKFVLTSRFGIKNDFQYFVLKQKKLISNVFKTSLFDHDIVVSTEQLNTLDSVIRLVRESQSLGTIGGVFHLAVVLNDCLLENQSIDKFGETIDSKAKSFENLNNISRELKLNLDYFVVFSSVSCGKGNSGQSNYGYANSVCERICEARRRDGLHGLAIQWGPIGDVGIMSNIEISSLSTLSKQPISSCLDTLDKLLQCKKTIISSVMIVKQIIHSGTKEEKMAAQIWKALGIDPKTTPNQLTLGEIGIESKFAVELQQGMDREYGIKVSLSDIKYITVGMLKDFESGKIDDMKRITEEIKEYRIKLSKVKFIIPSELHSKLNNVKIGKPIYFIPSIEGTFAIFEELAQKLDRPVIGLNWTRDMEILDSIQEISQYFINILNTLEPNGNCDIVCYSYGGLIAIEMIKSSLINNAVIIDLSTDIRMSEDINTDEHLIEIIINSISNGIPYVMQTKFKRDIQGMSDVPSKLKKMSNEIKEFVGKSLYGNDLEEILLNAFKRGKIFNNYRQNIQSKVNFSNKFQNLPINGKIVIINSFNNIEMVKRIENFYLLKEKGIENVIHYESIITEEIAISATNFDKISVIISKYFA